MLYYLKKAIFPLVYLLFSAVIAFGILCIQKESLTWLKYVLLVLNLALYVFIVGGIYFKEGQDAVKVRTANDLERRRIIETGEDRPLKLKEEYKPYKGFIMGLCAALPLIVLITVHVIIMISGGEFRTLGGIAALIYSVFFSFFMVGGELSMASYLFLLIFVPILSLSTGIPYIMGANKIIAQQDFIKEKQRQIYGDR